MTARFVVAGTHSGVGKTTVATGLMAAFAGRGRKVAGFKVGPDFIDPSYHALATGRPGRNLDAFMSGPDLIAPLFAHGATGADLAIVEGVMGMFDGASGSGELASTAQVAKLLRAPVVLVLDCSAMARSVAALVHGFVGFDPEVTVAGVILNRVGSDRHESLLREALRPSGLPVLGALHRRAALATPERHLGLVPVAERTIDASHTVAELAAAVAGACDLDAIESVASAAPSLTATPWDPTSTRGREVAEGDASPVQVRLGVASGPAFSFLYQENLELLEAAGAELAPLDPTRDGRLPDGISGLYLGGGFPETYAEALSANQPLRLAVREFAARGAAVIAECGGLLYLARSLDQHPMCGVLEADGRMTGRLTLGYRRAAAAAASSLADIGTLARGHEFHYSEVVPAAGARGGASGASAAWLLDGDRREGFVAGGVHASYLHTHWAAFPAMARRLVAAAREHAARSGGIRSGSHGGG
jgi:cobyrinic acid a,c-diamide synthase